MKRAIALCVLVGLAAAGCGARLDEALVKSRLVEQMQLRASDLRVRDISREDQPVATIDYGGVEAQVRFRRQEGVWVIDAVGQGGQWQSADRALSVLGQRLTEQARARWAQDVMPRYAKTLRLFVGWTELLGRACDSGLPASDTQLLDLYGAWHRTLFPNRGTEYHNADLFKRDAWRRALRVSLTSSRVDVQSGGADGAMDTADDLRVSFERVPRGTMMTCTPRFTVPAFAAEALGDDGAPTEWNCSAMLAAFREAGMLDVVSAQAPI